MHNDLESTDTPTSASNDDAGCQSPCTVLEMAVPNRWQQVTDMPAVALPPTAAHTLKHALVFKDISYDVGRGAHRKRLLHNITGLAKAGELYCLLSPSGSGKTTLLDVLAGRKAARQASGEVWLANKRAKPRTTKRLVGYCEQNDSLIELLTIREMLTYTARLAHRSKSCAEVRVRVSQLVEELGLSSAADTRIGGGLLPGISGGERKRAYVATIMVREPRFLLLDEVTSGLDAQAAAETVQVLQQLVQRRGLVCMLSVHAPSDSMFAAFSTVLVLAKGRVIYQGPTGSTAKYLQEALELMHAPAQHTGSAVSTPELAARLAFQVQNDDALAATLSVHYSTVLGATLEHQALASLQASWAEPLHIKEATERIPAWWTLWVLLQYRVVRSWTSPVFMAAQFLDKLFFSVVLLSLYWGIGRQPPVGLAWITNIAAALYIHSQLAAFSGMPYLSLLFRERLAFIREVHEGLLGVGTYLTSKVVEAVPIALLVSAVCNACLWPAVGLSGTWVLMWLVYALIQLVGVLHGITLWALIPCMELAAGLCSVTVILLCVLAGFLITYSQIPAYWRWLATINPLRFAWGAMMINQFGGSSNTTVGTSILPLQGAALQPSALQIFEFEGVNKWEYVGYMALALPVMLLINYVAVHLMLRYSKK